MTKQCNNDNEVKNLFREIIFHFIFQKNFEKVEFEQMLKSMNVAFKQFNEISQRSKIVLIDVVVIEWWKFDFWTTQNIQIDDIETVAIEIVLFLEMSFDVQTKSINLEIWQFVQIDVSDSNDNEYHRSKFTITT